MGTLALDPLTNERAFRMNKVQLKLINSKV